MSLFNKTPEKYPLPSCPVCGKPPKVKVEGGCGAYVTISCKKHNSFRVYSGKATLERAMSSARSQWYKRVRDYPNKKEGQWQ